MNEAYPAEISRAVEPQAASRSRVTEDELAALYRDGYHRFVRVAEAITRDPEEARDAVQEGFASACRELGRYTGSGSFEGWVWRCVVNAARMSLRKSRRRSFTPLSAPAVEQEHPALLRQIAQLPERQRLVLFLRYFGDLSYDGIAEALAVAPGTVAATLNAAHRTLRRQLEEGDDD